MSPDPLRAGGVWGRDYHKGGCVIAVDNLWLHNYQLLSYSQTLPSSPFVPTYKRIWKTTYTTG